MLQKTKGIVIYHTRYGESSAIIHIFTRELGMKSYIVNGIFGKKKKDKFCLLNPLNIFDFEVYNKHNKDIQRIKEFKLIRLQEKIPFSQERRAQTFFITEVLKRILHGESVDYKLFDFIVNAVIFLDSDVEGIENFHLIFLFQLTAFLGFAPNKKNAEVYQFFDLQEGCFASQEPNHPFFLTSSETKLFTRFFVCDNNNLPNLAKNVQERKILLKSIISLYERHFPWFIKINSIEILNELF